ncbi:VPLPA-CTERM sorting domain-containing protein [Dinoroseobacter sp. S76]|uniref:VPLPA-CTERM sorting domain-containing protein n=1 Tax=Dinoroseobacter sp. S76 TaxID=3415124 RepID=UPI003C7A20C2
MTRSLAIGLCVAAAAIAAPLAATATTYNINSIVQTIGTADPYPNGFGSSVFHDQTAGQMSGGVTDTLSLAIPSIAAPNLWDSATGDIGFTFALAGGGSGTATGTLNLTGTATSSIGYQSLAGTIDFAFSADSIFGATTQTFIFADTFHNPEANGTDLTQISLWGDLGNYNSADCGTGGSATCIGIDLRLGIKEQEPLVIPTVPLPAPALLLLAGLGGLGLMRRKA